MKTSAKYLGLAVGR